jgi:hypothetical protein
MAFKVYPDICGDPSTTQHQNYVPYISSLLISVRLFPTVMEILFEKSACG